MYERSRGKTFNARGSTRVGRLRRSRERTPPRQRSPPFRERSRPKFERNRSRERFHKRSRDRSPPRFERARSNERFEPPRQVVEEPGRFEPPPHEVERPRSFENERYVPPSPRFEERIDPEPLIVERNLSFDCPADYGKFPPPEERYYEGSTATNVNIPVRPALESSTPYVPRDKNENNDKPDPWTSGPVPSSSSQLQPTFGQEKGSTLIPEFDVETSDLTVNCFLRLIDKVGQEQSWSSHDKKFQFSMKLRGTAKEWFVNGNKFLESWASIKKQFRSSFPSDMDYYCLLTYMMQRTKRPEEDLSSYFNYKIVLLRNCNITGRKAVSCLIGGLPDSMAEIKANALDKNFATAEELYKYLIDENLDGIQNQEARDRKCNTCGKHEYCDCAKNETKMPTPDGNLTRPKESLKCYKDVYISGKKFKCLYDDEFPHITVRESDIDFLKIRYRRQITIINGYDRSNITSLGQAQIMVRIDNLFTEMPFHVVKDSVQDTPIVLGRIALKYPHTVNKNIIFFTAENKVNEFANRTEKREYPAIELRRESRSPHRRNARDHEFSMRRSSPDRNITRSPRRSPPGRMYKESTLFVSQFYGNPYA